MLSLVTMRKTNPIKIHATPACAVQTVSPRSFQTRERDILPKYLYLLVTFARPDYQPKMDRGGAEHQPNVSWSS